MIFFSRILINLGISKKYNLIKREHARAYNYIFMHEHEVTFIVFARAKNIEYILKEYVFF